MRSWPTQGGEADVAEVLLWFVDPEYRGLGLGSALLDTLRGVVGPSTPILLVTPAGDRHIDGTLSRSGFQPTGRLWVNLGTPAS